MLGLSAGAPRLPAASTLYGRPALTTRLAPGMFRLDTARVGGALLVAGQSLAEQDHIVAVLSDGGLTLTGAPASPLAGTSLGRYRSRCRAISRTPLRSLAAAACRA